MKSILPGAALAIIALMFTAVWSATPASDFQGSSSYKDTAPGKQLNTIQYFLKEPISAYTGRENLPWGEFWMCVKIYEKHGQRYVSVWNVLTKIGQWLVIDPSALQKQPSGKLEFQLKDNVDNKGLGQIEFIGEDKIRIEIKATKPLDDVISRNFLGQYGTFTLPRASCPFVRFIDETV